MLQVSYDFEASTSHPSHCFFLSLGILWIKFVIWSLMSES